MGNLDSVIDQLDGDELLTTGEVARLLGVSRQHVVDLCDRGDLPYLMVGSHRRIRRSDAERARQQRTKMTRDQRRSLWLGHAIAGHLVRDPVSVVESGRMGLRSMNSRPNKWTHEWERLLEGSVEDILKALTSTSLRSRELRQNSPFLGVLDPGERERILYAFSEAQHQ